jgi:hypothetical protein
MSDDHAETEVLDRTLIDIQQVLSLSYWSRRFGLSERELKDAVEAVGPEVGAVGRYVQQMA